MIADRSRAVCSFCGRDVGDERHVRAWEYDGWSFNPVCSSAGASGTPDIHGPYLMCRDCFTVAWNAMGGRVEEKIAAQRQRVAEAERAQADTPVGGADDGQE